MAPWIEHDLALVAAAPGWDASDEDRYLAGACATLEAEVREAEWTAFETLLPHFTPDGLQMPDDAAEQLRLIEATITLNWHGGLQAPPSWHPDPQPEHPRTPETPRISRWADERWGAKRADGEGANAEQWAALEMYVNCATVDDLLVPDDPDEATKLADAIVLLDWLTPGAPEQ